jgi:uncharacterized membrane protein YraQ (UPF0718 family)
MDRYLSHWADAALTTLGFFWMALWAFCLGYLISSLIQVFVTEERMRRTMGEAGPTSVALGAFFGFISSSCSFAALSTTRALFQKGAGLVPSLAFLLASTNLVIELGILIFIFLSWQFAVGEYLGGLLLILVMWALVGVTLPPRLEARAREHAGRLAAESEDTPPDAWQQRVRSLEDWRRVARRYWMEWGMVWKDVTFGFTVAGIISAFVPDEFFQALFVGSARAGGPSTWQVVLHTFIGPAAAFFTFIGSMGNVPLAGILFASGVSFAGVMAFLFSDLVVFPVLRISVRYFGWRMALYILGVFLVSLSVVSLVLHAGFTLSGQMPNPAGARLGLLEPTERFAGGYTLWLNLGFLAASAVLAGLAVSGGGEGSHAQEQHRSGMDWALLVLVGSSLAWLAGGVVVWLLR